MNEDQKRVSELCQKIDNLFQDEAQSVVDALNALSIMSTVLAVKVGIDRESYLKDIGIMFDNQVEHVAKNEI